MARNDPELRLRLPEGLKAEIEEHARKNQRSLNAEVVARLQESVAWQDYDIPTMAEQLENLESRLSKVEERIFEDPSNFD
jgi:uncharacterized coiled-coil protein SlyX